MFDVLDRMFFRLAAVSIAWVCLACADATNARPARPNLILVSLDTLRADRLGSYGYPRPTSPALDRLAGRGIRFANAFAESSWTLPSHATLFTGRRPTAHGATRQGRAIARSVPTLGEVLQQHGYRSRAFTDGGYMGPKYGFDRGFESYLGGERAGLEEHLRSAREWIESLPDDAPWFLFVHSFDIHCPYDPPERYRVLFDAGPAEDRLETAGKCAGQTFNKMQLTPGQVRFLSDMYDAGIRAADDQLEEFFEFVDARDGWDDTIVAVVSDHGEEFHEHGRIGHGRTLYVEQLRIPWIISAPDLAAGVVSQAVGLADVMPTLLALLGIEAPESDGRSLVPEMRGEIGEASERVVFSELDAERSLRSAIRGSFHLIRDRRSQTVELYDLRSDATEQRVLDATSRQASGLASLLRLYAPTPPADAARFDLQVEDRDALRALGYEAGD